MDNSTVAYSFLKRQQGVKLRAIIAATPVVDGG